MTLADLKMNMFEGLGDEALLPPGAVVLRRATQKAQPRYRFLTTFKEGHMRSPIDYYNTLVNGRKPTPKEPQDLKTGLSFLPSLRKKAQVFVSHPPLLLDVPTDCRHTTLMLPKDDPLLNQHSATSSTEDGDHATETPSAGESFEMRQLRAVLRGLGEYKSTHLHHFTTGARDGGLISLPLNGPNGKTAVDLHIDRRHDGPKSALARLRELGHYLPCVYYDDQMYFEKDVVEAFGRGYVTVSGKYQAGLSAAAGGGGGGDGANSMTHLRSILQLWNMGFNLVLEDLHKDQVRKLRTLHGECEALIIGQRLSFKYDQATEVPHQTAGGGENAVTFLTVRHTERLMDPVPATASSTPTVPEATRHIAQVRKLLQGCEDFPQRQQSSFEKLLHTRPSIDEPKISEMFQDLKASVEIHSRQARVKYNSGLAVGSRGKNRSGQENMTQLIKDTQTLCSSVDVRQSILDSWSKNVELKKQCTEAAFRQAATQRHLRWVLAKRVGTACGSYTDEMERTLTGALVDSKVKAISHYRNVAKKQTSTSHFTSLKLPLDDQLETPEQQQQQSVRGLPFYDNVLC